jgi:hypothetical protein
VEEPQYALTPSQQSVAATLPLPEIGEHVGLPRSASALTKPWYGEPGLVVAPLRTVAPRLAMAPASSGTVALPQPSLPSMAASTGSGPALAWADDPAVSLSPTEAVAQTAIEDLQVEIAGERRALSGTETVAGVSMGPLRELLQHADGRIYWFHDEKRVRAVAEGTSFDVTIGSREALLNNQPRLLELAPYLKQGHTMVPLQFVAEALDLTLSYEPTTGQVVLSSASW